MMQESRPQSQCQPQPQSHSGPPPPSSQANPNPNAKANANAPPSSSPPFRRRHANQSLWGAVEIIPNRLYYAPLKFVPPQETQPLQPQQSQQFQSNSSHKPIHYFSIDDVLLYWNFFLDYGPLNLGQLHRFCSALNAKLSSPHLADHVICYHSGPSGERRSNAVVLICAWQMLYLGRTLEEAYWGFRASEEEKEEEEREAEEVMTSWNRRSRERAAPPSQGRNCSWPPDKKKRPEKETTAYSPSSSSSSSLSSSAGSARNYHYHAMNNDTNNHQNNNIQTFVSNSNNQNKRQHDEHSGRIRDAHGPTHDSNTTIINTNNNNTNTTSNAPPDTEETLSPFAKLHPLPPFHDASPIICTFDLTVYDVLCGLDKARKHGFFRFADAVNHQVFIAANNDNNNDDNDAEDSSPSHPPSSHSSHTHSPSPSPFDVHQYEHFEQVENGDLNWILQDKIIAFAGPHSRKLITPEGFCMLTPADYLPHFTRPEFHVRLIIRLNKKCYDESEFTKAGIRHVDHYYLDGSCPDMSILHSVLRDMESIRPEEAMAVHCKAGLGRTGTCIGAYLMKHFRLTAREAIGWMRICRPGMVIGPQQHFLQDVERVMWQEGEVYRSGRGLGGRRNPFVLPWRCVGAEIHDRGGGGNGGGNGNSGGNGRSDEDANGTGRSAHSSAPTITATRETVATNANPAGDAAVATPNTKRGDIHSRISVITPEYHQHELIVRDSHDMAASTEDSPEAMLETPESAARNATTNTKTTMPTMDNLKVRERASAVTPMASRCDTRHTSLAGGGEEPQAHGLLARRLDQFQARQGQSPSSTSSSVPVDSSSNRGGTTVASAAVGGGHSAR